MEEFVAEIKNFGVANWILIGCMAFIMLMLIIIVVINIKIMKKYRVELTRTRVARLVGRIEMIDGWCCAVVENVGQTTATNVKVKLSGSIIKYYYNYVTKCRVSNALKEVLGSKFTLVAGDRRQLRLFPLTGINDMKSIMETRSEVIAPEPDVNLIGKTEPSDELEIEELVDDEDAKVLKAVGKQQKKLAKERAKQDKKYNAKLMKINVKKQKVIKKLNKKNGNMTHTSIIEQPDLTPIAKRANAEFNITYESLGYLFKNKKFKYRGIDLTAQPMEIRTQNDILSAQNGLLEQIVFLQRQIRDTMCIKTDKSNSED